MMVVLTVLMTSTALGTLWALTQPMAGAPASVVSTRFAATPSDGIVKSQKISQTEGSITGTLDDDDRFAVTVTSPVCGNGGQPGEIWMATASRIWPLALIGMMTGT